MIKTEKLSKKNLDAVCEIEKICFSHPWSRDDLALQTELDTSHFLVAFYDGEAAGYMGLQIFARQGFVTNIAVLPRFRRKGIASALIAEQCKNDIDFITLEVRQSNTAAIELYKKAGFEAVGVRPGFYTDPEEDAVIMTKEFKNEDTRY